MEIGHSRLLKFILPNASSKMSVRQQLRVEYISAPTDVESEVPEHQSVRQPPADAEQTLDGGKDDESTFVPVYKTKKEEAVFTKGDTKLQKVSVTEDISKSDNKIQNPMYSEVHSEVIQDQHLRTKETSEIDPEINKSRTRIPQMKHKVDMIRQDRDEPRAQKGRKMLPRHPRRSSIPKLKRVTSNQETETKTDLEVKSEQEQNHIQPIVTHDKNENVPPEEEFDKIFDGIIHNDEEPTDVLLDNYEDAEKLEHSFQEIVQDYEENKIQPIDIKQVRNKPPFLKQKSLPEVKFAKKLERRRSLKDIPIDNITNETKPNKVVGSKLEDIRRKFNANHVKENDSNKVRKTLKSGDTNINDLKSDMQSDEIKKEIINVVTPALSEYETYATQVIKQEKVNENIDKTVEKLEVVNHSLCDEKTEKVNGSGSDESYISEDQKNKLSQKYVNSSQKKEEDELIHDIKNKTTHIPKLREAVSKNTNNSSNAPTQPSKKDFVSEIPKKTVISKISVFNKSTYNSKPHTGDKSTENLNEVSKKHAVQHNVEGPRVQEMDLNKISASQKDSARDTELEKSESSKSRNIRQESIEKLKFVNNESMPQEIPKTLNTKLKLKLDSVTPPNTPQTHDNEPYRDSAHLAGEPKILNIDTNKEFKSKISLEPSSHNNTCNQYEDDSINQQTTSSQNHKSVKPQLKIKTKRSARDVYNQIDYETSPNIYFNSPNPDEFDKAPLFEAVNKNMNAESNYNENEKNNASNEKVSKILKRINSFDEKTVDTMKNEVTIRIPVKESVLSKIAMFESQVATSSNLKTKVVRYNKPKIIEEVLKTQQRNNINSDQNQLPRKGEEKGIIDDNIISFKTIQHVAKIVELDLTHDGQEDMIVGKTDNRVAQLDTAIKLDIKNDTMAVSYNKENAKEIKAHDHRINLEEKYTIRKREKEEIISVKERLNRMKSVKKDGDLKKSKSLAELDLGDAVKGKVHQIIVRMNSIENILDKKHDNINIRERPRKKSVSEKIALFENKLVVFDKVDNPTFKPPPVEFKMPAPCPDYNALIKALDSAKTTYGRVGDDSSVKLNNGLIMPALAIGTALTDSILLPHIIGAAIDLGYRAIDTAFVYGNEGEIGEAIKAKIDDGTVERKDLFIIGKLWNTFHQQDLVEKACLDSLNKLGLKYFDMYLIHYPMSFMEGSSALPTIDNVLQYSEVADYIQAWHGMEGLIEKGLAKSIGVSNFNSVQIQKVLENGTIKPVVNQVECHPYLAQRRLDEFCAERNVNLMCYGSLGSRGTPDQYRDSKDIVLDDPVVKAMAAGLNITPAQLLIAYQLESGHAVVTKSSSAKHLFENLQAQSVKLTEAQLGTLHALNADKRTYSMLNMGDTHPNYPFRIPF